jgi:hypothetical protein
MYILAYYYYFSKVSKDELKVKIVSKASYKKLKK